LQRPEFLVTQTAAPAQLHRRNGPVLSAVTRDTTAAAKDALPPHGLDTLAEALFKDPTLQDVDGTVVRFALFILAGSHRREKCSKLLRQRRLVPWVAEAMDAIPSTVSGDGITKHLVPTGSEEELAKTGGLVSALAASLTLLGFPHDHEVVSQVLTREEVADELERLSMPSEREADLTWTFLTEMLPHISALVQEPAARAKCVPVLRRIASEQPAEDFRAATELVTTALARIPASYSGEDARKYVIHGEDAGALETMLRCFDLEEGELIDRFELFLTSILVAKLEKEELNELLALVGFQLAGPSTVSQIISPAGSSANTGYRWSRSQPGDAAERVNITARAASAKTTEAPDVEEDDTSDLAPGSKSASDFEEWVPPPPPPPAFFTMMGVPTVAQPAAAAPAKAKGFGGTAKAKAAPADSSVCGGDHKSDKTLLVSAERQFFQLLDWHNAHLPGGQFTAVISARCKPDASGRVAEPALGDWLPLCTAIFVHGQQLRGNTSASLTFNEGIPALLVGYPQLRNVAMAALRVAVPTTAVRKLTWLDLEWAFESIASADVAFTAARKAGTSAVDDVAQAARLLNLQSSDISDRAVVRAAYRRAAAASHPDQSSGDATRFAAVQAAYELLTQRAATSVDSSLRDGFTSGAATGYAAWDLSRRTFDGPLRLPASVEEATAVVKPHGGLGCVAMVLGDGVEFGQEQTKFFARRNTFAIKQAAAEASSAKNGGEKEKDERGGKQKQQAKGEKAKQQQQGKSAGEAAAKAAAAAAKDVAAEAVKAAEQQVAQATATVEEAAVTATRAAEEATKQAKASVAAAIMDAMPPPAPTSEQTSPAAPTREFVSRRQSIRGQTAQQVASGVMPEMSAFLDTLDLAPMWRAEVDATFEREGLNRVTHVAQLEIEDLLAVGIKRIPARLIIKAAQQLARSAQGD